MKDEEILDSWKEIADYLERDKRTCYRWEKQLGLPVHRIDDLSLRSKVFAYKSEIDDWLRIKAGDREASRGTQRLHRILYLIIPIVIVVILLSVYLLFMGGKDSSHLFSSAEGRFPAAFEELPTEDLLGTAAPSSMKGLLQRLEKGEEDPWQVYYRGKYYLDKNTRESNDLAVLLFLEVIKSKTSIPVAYAGLAQCYANYVEFQWDSRREWLSKAEEILSRIQDQVKIVAEYYSVSAGIELLKYSYFGEDTKKEAFSLIQEGLKSFPHDPQINHYASNLYRLRFDESGDPTDFGRALQFGEKAFWMNPYSLKNRNYAELLMLDRKYDQAEGVCRLMVKFDSTPSSQFLLGEICYFAGDLDESRGIFSRFDTPLELRVSALMYRGMIASRQGNTEVFHSILRDIDLLSLEDERAGEHTLKMASMYFGADDDEKGYSHLQTFFEGLGRNNARHIALKYMGIDPNFKKIQNSERFRKLISKFQ